MNYIPANKPQNPEYVHPEFDHINTLIRKMKLRVYKKKRGTKFSYLKVKYLISL